MKKIIIFLTILAFAAVAFAAETAKPSASPELRPLQKTMQARAALMKSMNGNLADKNFKMLARNAGTLSTEAKKTGAGAPNPLAKELHLAVSDLAKATAAAAKKKDGDAVTAKLGEIKAKCAECHAKIRDKDKK
jgi:hypothetical protein